MAPHGFCHLRASRLHFASRDREARMKSWLIPIGVAAAGLLSSGPSNAVPIGNLASIAPNDITNVGLLCTPSGQCYESARRHRVVRIYGQGFGYYRQRIA